MMNFQSFKDALSANPELDLLLSLPSGTTVAQHFHVTEVGKVTKNFVDCGGTRRENVSCVLQTMVSDDVEHRIRAAKLFGILEKAASLDLRPEMAVDAEIQEGTISVYSFDTFQIEGRQIVFSLGAKQTECLAHDVCGIEPGAVSLPVSGAGDG